jgi:hypothetical protein
MRRAIRLTLWGSLNCAVFAGGLSSTQIPCPEMPDKITQVNHDVRSDVDVGIGSLGKLKAGQVGVQTDVVAKNLFDKYPNIDRIVVVQMMAATYCPMIRDDRTLKDSDKRRLWSEFSDRVFKFQNPSYRPSPAQPPNSKHNTTREKTKQSSLGPSQAGKTEQSKAGAEKTVQVASSHLSGVAVVDATATLKDLFLTDFDPTLFRSKKEATLTLVSRSNKFSEQTLPFTGQLYINMREGSKFLGFYVPVQSNDPDEASSRTLSLCKALPLQLPRILQELESLQLTIPSASGSTVRSNDLLLSGRIYIYHEDFIPPPDLGDLVRQYEGMKLSVEFRGTDYLQVQRLTRVRSAGNAIEQTHGTTESVTAVPKRHGTTDDVEASVTKESSKAYIAEQQEQHNLGGTNVQRGASDNSGNISQSGPCSVVQIGGDKNQATTNCTFGEVKPKPLSLTPKQVEDVAAAMRPFADLAVRLIVVNGNEDDDRFANALGAALESAGIEWQKSRTGMLFWNGSGTTPQGLSCTHSPDTDAALDALGQALKRVGVIGYPIPCKIRDSGSKWFNLYVTEK